MVSLIAIKAFLFIYKLNYGTYLTIFTFIFLSPSLIFLWLCRIMIMVAIMNNPMFIKRITSTGTVNAHINLVSGLRKHLERKHMYST